MLCCTSGKCIKIRISVYNFFKYLSDENFTRSNSFSEFPKIQNLELAL